MMSTTQIVRSASQTRGSSSGAVIELKDVCISIGNNDILTNVNWQILPKERWALVGRNGEGKSTLLKACLLQYMSNEMISVRSGEILMSQQCRLGYLEQKGVSGSTLTVRQEVSSRMERLSIATKKLEYAEKLVSEGDTSDEALKLLEDASIEFETAGGYTVEQKISNVLKGLGFLPEDYDRLCSEFSGGWQMRIALARLLLSEPDLLLLDEPTNHLDKPARDWLSTHLSNYDGTLLLVSHDENLLKTAVTSIAEVQKGDVQLYKSRSHDQWQIEREERVKAALTAYEANQREIARLQVFVDRFGAKTMGASLAQSKLKAIEKLENASPEAPKTNVDGPPPKLVLPPPPRGSKVLLTITNGSAAWQNKKILDSINLTIERGWRIAVRGPNGSGKSTLFATIAGELPLSSGSRVVGDGLELGIFKQDLAQELDQSLSAVEVVTQHVRARDPTISDEKARTVLGSLGLIKEKGVRLVGMLSGGEKARVALACFVLMPHNLLLLDEPSNHLDTQCIGSLTEGIKKFTGTTVVISHDKPFLEEFDPTHVLTVRDGKVTLEERGLRDEDWNDLLNSRESSNKFNDTPKDAKAESKVPSPSSNNASKMESKSSTTGKKKGNSQRIGKIESLLEKYEAEMTSIDSEMLNNGRNRDKLYELQKDKNSLQEKIDKLYHELESL